MGEEIEWMLREGRERRERRGIKERKKGLGGGGERVRKRRVSLMCLWYNFSVYHNNPSSLFITFH